MYKMYLRYCPGQLISASHRRFFTLLQWVLLLAALPMPWAGYAQTSPATFNYTGAVQTFTVPNGVTSLTVVANGAQGGATASGGKGGRVTATLAVIPSQILSLYVGGQGTVFNGGGTSGGSGGRGGGATDIRIGGTALSNRIIVAGGGGGWAGLGVGGAGGGLIGGSGSTGYGTGGGGGGGSQSTGGIGGAGFGSSYSAGGAGIEGVGGNGGTVGSGGGGGGYYGGGGSGYFGSGGGGSSYPDPANLPLSNGGVTVTSVVHEQGVNTGNGSITLSWVAGPLPVALVSFTAQAQPDKSVALHWATAWETSNKGYRIERSKDLITFETVGELTELAPNSNALTNYHLTDRTPYAGTSYYRLTQTDLSGKATTYQAVSVVIREEAYGVFPNPVAREGSFVLRLDEPQTAILGFYSPQGRTLPLQKTGIQSGNLLLKASGALPAGIYLLTVEERGQIRQHRLVVQ